MGVIDDYFELFDKLLPAEEDDEGREHETGYRETVVGPRAEVRRAKVRDILAKLASVVAAHQEVLERVANLPEADDEGIIREAVAMKRILAEAREKLGGLGRR